MTDVVEIANERRAALAAELSRLDFFLRMAEQLVKDSRLESNRASAAEDETAAEDEAATEDETAAEDETATESTGPAKVRPYSTDTDGNGADAEREDLSVRALKSGERVDKSRAILNEPSPDRPRGLGFFHQKAT